MNTKRLFLNSVLKRLMLLCLFFLVGMSAQSAIYKIVTANYIISAQDGNPVIRVFDSTGRVEYLKVGKLMMEWTPLIVPVGCTYELTESGGVKVLKARYSLGSSVPQSLTMTGTFTASDDEIDVRFDINGVPDGYVSDWGGSQFTFIPSTSAKTLYNGRIGIWKRNVNGGLPDEAADAKMECYQIGDRNVSLAFSTENKPYAAFNSDALRHTVIFNPSAGSYYTDFSIVVSPSDWSVDEIYARWQRKKAAVRLYTDKVYNWWEDPSEPVKVHVAVHNTSDETQNLILKYWVRNFAGNYMSRQSLPITLEPNAVYGKEIAFNSPSDRDIFIAEASVEDASGTELTFTRTNLAMLPPYTFSASPDNSIMGISSFWSYPDSAQMERLMDRMGVRWLRNGNSADYPKMNVMYHNNIDWDKQWTDIERNSFIRQCFNEILANGNKIWEFGNENNMDKPGGIAVDVDGIGKGYLAGKYVEWLKAIRNVQKMNSMWKDIQLVSCGMAGFDKVFLDSIVIKGGWDLLDGVALHPGRGNYTADYPIESPWNRWPELITTINPWNPLTTITTEKKYYESYWNYYGSVRRLRNYINDHGGNKDIYLTEVYSLDRPNDWWNDTPRSATESLLLSYALASAEGVRNALYYQMFNSVWYDQLGVDETNREYYFGLINRDMSFKPILLAYCNAAEVLDGAVFKAWIKFNSTTNAKTKGMLFDTPKGPMAILWDRSEGYKLSSQSLTYASTEMWVPTWSRQTVVTMPVTGSTATVVNTIGQRSEVGASQQNCLLTLTGEPIIVYGLDVSRMSLYIDPAEIGHVGSELTTDDDALYNLSGQRVDPSYKGIVIKNGRKFLNR